MFEPERVTGTGDVSIFYDGTQIGTLSDSGSLTFSTAGKVVEHDIGVNYAKPDAPSTTIKLYKRFAEDDAPVYLDNIVSPLGGVTNILISNIDDGYNFQGIKCGYDGYPYDEGLEAFNSNELAPLRYDSINKILTVPIIDLSNYRVTTSLFPPHTENMNCYIVYFTRK